MVSLDALMKRNADADAVGRRFDASDLARTTAAWCMKEAKPTATSAIRLLGMSRRAYQPRVAVFGHFSGVNAKET
jgi:hypothetical protein